MQNKIRNKRRVRRSTWMPALLLVYLVVMTCWFAPSLIANGEIARLVIVFVSEILIIFVLHKFLKKRERQEQS